MSRRYRWSLLAVVLIALLYVAWAELTKPRGVQKVSFRPSRQKCLQQGVLDYCINYSPTGSNGDVLYHLHGRSLDATVWNDETYFTSMIQAQWQAARTPAPVVVTISYGGTWLLTPKGTKARSGLLDDFMRTLPRIESGIGPIRRRILLGESMGGLNVLIAGLSHPDKFAKIAALCPGVYKVSPFASFSEMKAALARTGADPKIAFGTWWLARDYVANEEEWRRISPLQLVEGVRPSQPELYLSNGLYDGYGNFEGTERLASVARSRGGKVEWHPLYGGHCAIDVQSLAAFLVR